MRKRRPAKLLLVCLLLGAIVNVLVAWGLVLFNDRVEERSQHEINGGFVETWRTHVPSDWSRLPEIAFVSTGTFGMETLSLFDFGIAAESLKRAPDWSGSIELEGVRATSDKTTFRGLSRLQVGWPLHAMEFMVIFDTASVGDPQNINATKPIDFPFNLGTRRLPYGPLWPGLFANTIFYAAIVWLMIRGPWETRRRWRELHGKCGACGYPRGESPICTECGGDLSKAWGHAAKS